MLDVTTPNHYTTVADYVFQEKSRFYSFSMKLTELLTVKKQCKRIFHGNEWMKEHNYAL